MAAITSARSSCVPWLMFTRKASAPARSSARIISGERDAGTSVARMRTLRGRGGKDSGMIPFKRAEERRVGKKGVSTCRYRWSLYHITTPAKTDYDEPVRLSRVIFNQ